MTRIGRICGRHLAWGLIPALIVPLVLVCLIPLHLYDGLAHGAGSVSAQASLQGQDTSFTIMGSVEHISPGLMQPLDLKLTNLHDRSLTLTKLHVNMREVDAPNSDEQHPCSLADFVVVQPSALLELSLSPEASRTLADLGLPVSAWPHVGMVDLPTNQDGCKEATMTLDYTALASTQS